MCAWAFAKVAMRDAQLLNRFADEALRKYTELNGQNVPPGRRSAAYLHIVDFRGISYMLHIVNILYSYIIFVLYIPFDITYIYICRMRYVLEISRGRTWCGPWPRSVSTTSP